MNLAHRIVGEIDFLELEVAIRAGIANVKPPSIRRDIAAAHRVTEIDLAVPPAPPVDADHAIWRDDLQFIERLIENDVPDCSNRVVSVQQPARLEVFNALRSDNHPSRQAAAHQRCCQSLPKLSHQLPHTEPLKVGRTRLPARSHYTPYIALHNQS